MELITVSEAARRVGVRREAIYYSVKAGKIKAHRELVTCDHHEMDAIVGIDVVGLLFIR